MENKIIFLIVTILLLWLLLSKNGATMIKNLISNATSNTSSNNSNPITNPNVTSPSVPKYDGNISGGTNNGDNGDSPITNHNGIGGGTMNA